MVDNDFTKDDMMAPTERPEALPSTQPARDSGEYMPEVPMAASRPVEGAWGHESPETFINGETIDPKLGLRDTDTDLFRPRDATPASPEELGHGIEEEAPSARRFSSVQELQDVVSPEHRGLFSSPDVMAELRDAGEGLAGSNEPGPDTLKATQHMRAEREEPSGSLER